MKALTRLTVLLSISMSLVPDIHSQSVWDRMKQAAKQQQTQQHAAAQPAGQTQRQTPAPASQQAFHPTGPTGTPELTAQLAQTAGFLDVTGIKLGMTTRDAMTALKAHNNLLKITPQTYVHELIPNQTLVSGVRAEIPLVSGEIFEQYDLAFSMQPSGSFVTAVARTLHFPADKKPTFSNVLEGLRGRYGHETFVPRAAASLPAYFWIFDLKGNPVNGPEAQRIVEICTGPFMAIDWQRAVDAVTLGYDERKHAIGALGCSSYATVGAYFQGSVIPGQSEYLLDNLEVVISNGALYRSGVEATHSQYLAAQKNVDADKMKNAAKQKVDY